MNITEAQPTSAKRHRKSEQPGPITPEIERALTENYRNFLRYLTRRVGDAATADDVLQNFCIRVLRNKTVLRNEKSVVAWLYTVLPSLLTDHYRKEAVHRRHNESYVNDQLVLADDSSDVESEAGTCGCVRAVLPELRRDYAEVLQRVDLTGEPREQVAMALGISLTNVRVRLHRARQAVLKALKRYCGGCCEQGFRDCFCRHARNRMNARSGSEIAQV
ncbi:MAG: RNA polymerase sigma factor [Halocynthiibacter sp.]